MDDQPPVIAERDGHVTVLTINRPEVMNAIDRRTSHALADAFARIEADPACWVTVLTGAGDRAFCAGADLKELRDLDIAGKSPRRPGDGHPAGGLGGITRGWLTKPVIGAINGLAYGGGFEVALALDLLIAAEHATFCLPEVRRGFPAGAGALLRLPRQVPPRVAMQWALEGEPIDMHAALGFGLVNRVVPGGELLDAALALAEAICAGSPAAVMASKAVIDEVAELPMVPTSGAWAVHDDRVAVALESPDVVEGRQAFFEGRRPRWASPSTHRQRY